MHIINQEEMKYLSFPDYDVEKMEYLPLEKSLKIFVEGGWLDTDRIEGHELGKGILFFSDWDFIFIKRHNAQIKEGLPEGRLNDLCEVIFSNSIVFLSGFGPDDWIEWIMIKPKMHAEFEGYKEDED